MINEAYFFALEAVPSFLAMFCYNIVHPGTVLIGKESELPSLKAVVWDSWIKKRDIRPRKLMVEEDGEYLAGSYTALPDDKQTRGREMELRKL